MLQENLELAQRLQIIEDKLAIYELIASHPPSADTAMAEYTLSVYLEKSEFNRGPHLDGAEGAEAIAAFILRPEHEEALANGLAHFTGLPLIDLRGDSAVVTSYLQLIYLDDKGESRMLANHGSSPVSHTPRCSESLGVKTHCGPMENSSQDVDSGGR